ncbi:MULTISPECIES: aldehyde dehydrogenase family protein [Pacificibacter]|uniref:aldehyde dehydrogenase family protein n=1 Tax=Pacificibacter TaxID=1042323 RepID=UPI001C08F82B|nr:MULTISPECIES: aldehyde dehydrogenase family protein [Pacificibacter]MBU2936701.1 aldehyde dehydrogenase family protein [Pacificibacter marinus]MDO6614497.1 aldehyde dehydrogenase family protein [Pacificibacter sp. 1_MG-2023]
MLTLNKFYIDGAWVDPASDATMPIMNPATEAQIGTVSMGNSEDVDRAVAAAKRAFETFSMTTKAERLALLENLRAATVARLGDLAAAMTSEMGAPATMSLDVQAQSGLGHLDDFIAALKNLDDEETLPNGDIISREPIGVCGLITPWNWPINQIALKVVPALATGATCVLKPSEHTPISAQIYAEIVEAAGYPAGVFNLVQGDGISVGSAMSRHPDIAMMSFTGSTRAGTAVSKDAADGVKRVTLELGGKSPNLVFADADLEKRVTESVQGCFYNTGQSCNAPTRLLIERSCYDEVLEIAKAAGEAQTVGDPAQQGDHIGPVFDKIQYDRVQAMIKVGIDEGARVLVGGLGKPEGLETGWYVKPTIFCDVDHDMRISREEIFGPVLVITPFDSEEDAIKMANDTDYGLAAYIQSSDEARVSRVVRRLRAGTIQINGRGPDYGSPFGGYKQSGNGREGGVFGLEDYLEIKVRPPFTA